MAGLGGGSEPGGGCRRRAERHALIHTVKVDALSLYVSNFCAMYLLDVWSRQTPRLLVLRGVVVISLVAVLERGRGSGRGCSGRLRADVKETKTDTNNTKKTTTTATTTTTTTTNNNNNNDLALSSSPPAGCLRSHATRPFLLPDNQR